MEVPKRHSALSVAATNFPVILTLVSPFLTLNELMRLLASLVKVVSVPLKSPGRQLEEASFAPISTGYLKALLLEHCYPFSKAASRFLRKALRKNSCRVVYRGREEQSVARSSLKALHALMSRIPLEFPRSFNKKSKMSLVTGGINIDITFSKSRGGSSQRRVDFVTAGALFSVGMSVVNCSIHKLVSLLRCRFCRGLAACSACLKRCNVCKKRACSACHSDFASCFNCQQSFCSDCLGHSFQAGGNSDILLSVCQMCEEYSEEDEFGSGSDADY